MGAALFIGTDAWSQQPPLPPTIPYGTPITLEQAKKVADAAEAGARKRNMNMAIAVVEPSGDLVYLRRMDGTQYSSIEQQVNTPACPRLSDIFVFSQLRKHESSTGNELKVNIQDPSSLPRSRTTVVGQLRICAIEQT